MTDRHPNKQKGAGTPISKLPEVDSTTSSSALNTTPVKKPKRGLKPLFRDLHDLFARGKQSTKQQEQSAVISDTNDTSQNSVPTSESATAAQDDSLQSKRLDIGISNDPNDQWKVDAIDYSIQVIELFGSLTDIIGLVVPDALGQVLEKITTILEKLKVRSLFGLILQSSVNHSGCFI